MSKSCAKCGGRMDPGFVATTTSHGNGVAQRPQERGLRVEVEADGPLIDGHRGHVPGA